MRDFVFLNVILRSTEEDHLVNIVILFRRKWIHPKIRDEVEQLSCNIEAKFVQASSELNLEAPQLTVLSFVLYPPPLAQMNLIGIPVSDTFE